MPCARMGKSEQRFGGRNEKFLAIYNLRGPLDIQIKVLSRKLDIASGAWGRGWLGTCSVIQQVQTGTGTQASWFQNHLLSTFLLAKVSASIWPCTECEKRKHRWQAELGHPQASPASPRCSSSPQAERSECDNHLGQHRQRSEPTGGHDL